MQWTNPDAIRAYAKDPNHRRPVSTTSEGRQLSSYLYANLEFRDELKALRPDWFTQEPILAVEQIHLDLDELSITAVLDAFSQSTRSPPYRGAYAKKEAYLKQALAKEPRPEGRPFTTYMANDPAFRRLIELIRPQWLERKIARRPSRQYGPEVKGARRLRGPRQSHPNRKLSDEDYIAILKAWQANPGQRGFYSEQAKKYGVSIALISRLIKRAFKS